MSWIRSGSGRAVIGIVAALGLMMAVAVTLRMSGVRLGFEVRSAIAIIAAVPAFWFVINYWRSLDEAAREAQKWGWFWGGSHGLGLGFLAVSFWPDQVAALLPAGSGPERLMLLGALVVGLSQVVGFLLAWAFWWWRRR
jgi:hypothetical protein